MTKKTCSTFFLIRSCIETILFYTNLMFYALFPNFNNTSIFSYLFRDDNLNDLYCFESVTASEMGSGVLTCEVIIIDSQTYVFEIFIEKIL